MREVAGNRQLQIRLARSVAADLVHHAYLFTGPESVGKTTLALAFARLLMCEHPDLIAGESCDECRTCRIIAHGNHPDLTLVETAPGKALLGVEQVRESVVRLANLAPSQARRRVFIVPAVEQMTIHTTNALLKTLEEPPSGVVVLLTAADVDSVLPTVVSRCQVFTLHSVASEEVESLLIRVYQATPQDAKVVAALSQGRPGWAVRAYQHPEHLEERRSLLDQILQLPKSRPEERLRLSAVLAKDGDVARQALEIWTLWWRDVVLAAASATNLVSADGAREEAERLGSAVGLGRAATFLHSLVAARENLEQNANARLVFDVLMLDLPTAPPGV